MVKKTTKTTAKPDIPINIEVPEVSVTTETHTIGYLLPDWLNILRKAWSMRLLGLSAVLSALEMFLPYFDEVIPVPKYIFGALAFMTSIAAGIARLIAQKGMSK